MTHYHFIGIGGTGLSPIAKVLLEKGHRVSGSDRILTPLAQELINLGVQVHIGESAANVTGANVVIRSSAVQDDNPEVKAALEAKIPVLKRADFLRHLIEPQMCLAVAGTHGKTSTTSMLAWVLSRLGADPSFVIGGVSKDLHTNAKYGKGKYFVIEADEYDNMFLGLAPQLAIVTSIEHDHPDCFPTPDLYRQAFVNFVQCIGLEGVLLTSADNPISVGLVTETAPGVSAYTFGLDEHADFIAENVHLNLVGGYSFNLISKRENRLLCQVNLQVPGQHNVSNALAVMSAIYLLQLPLDKAALAMANYSGTARRFEIIGEAAGVTVIDDYAHHPTEIKATLAAARQRFSFQRIWAVWQPHTYSRVFSLEEQFLQAFKDAEKVIVTEVYASREHNEAYSSREFFEKFPHPGKYFAPNLQAATQLLLSELQTGDVVIVLSAGDANQICKEILTRLKERVNRYGR